MSIERLYHPNEKYHAVDLERWVREGGWNLWQAFCLCKGGEPQEITAEDFFRQRTVSVLYPDDTPTYVFEFVADYEDFATKIVRSPFSLITPLELNKHGAHRSLRDKVVFNPENASVQDPVMFVDWAVKNGIAVNSRLAETVYRVATGSKERAANIRLRRTAERTRFEEYLTFEMRKSPEKNPKSKSDWRATAIRLHRLTNLDFEDAWKSALKLTKANWNKAGRPRKS